MEQHEEEGEEAKGSGSREMANRGWHYFGLIVSQRSPSSMIQRKLKNIVDHFPHQRFLFVGDSGQGMGG